MSPAHSPAASLDAARAELHRHLQAAIELELATLPPYITAYASIGREANREAALVIHSVFMEEMLHLVLAANVLIATGGSPRLGEANAPRYPLTLSFESKGFRDRRFEVHLASFSRATLETFLNIELPDGFRTAGRSHPKPYTGAEELEGRTIGEFYAHIQTLLTDLCAAHGDAAVFTGNPDWQIDERYFWFGGGKPIVVRDLPSATDALGVIVRQGEGVPGAMDDGDALEFQQRPELAHFFRFAEIYFGRRYRPGDRPHQPPTGEPLAVDYAAAIPVRPDPQQRDYSPGTPLAVLNQEFNVRYTLMLRQLEEGLNGNPYALYTAIKDGMHGIAVVAARMMRIPVPHDPEGRFGAPSFEWVPPPVPAAPNG